jgi:methionine sulfoxide reductase heme-binding subunit
MLDRFNLLLRRVPAGLLYPMLAVPAIYWWTLALQNRLGADPVRALEHEFGLLCLQLLIGALCIRPLRERLGLNLLKFRRAIGLMAFFYAAMHFAVWLWLDRQFDWPRLLADLVKRPFIVIGFAAFLMLVPLAATSNNRSIRTLGGVTWRKLHRLAYPATALGALHFVWLVKAWPLEPLIYAGTVAILLVYRAIPQLKPAAQGNRRRTGRGHEKKLS